jgi:hypothetical protein
MTSSIRPDVHVANMCWDGLFLLLRQANKHSTKVLRLLADGVHQFVHIA